MKIRIGTRKSRLAVIQAELVRDQIQEKFPEAEVELILMSTRGDKALDRSLSSFGGKGVFTNELETALAEGEIDLAVHSAKDMPVEFFRGLSIGAVLDRGDPRDVLVTRSGIAAQELPAGSIIGTSSLRREFQIRRLNPGVEIRLLRGNVQTRLEKLRTGEYDGILLAAAGLERLGLTKPDGLFLEYFDVEQFVPAPGQGILAVEQRSGEWKELMAAIHSETAAVALQAERNFLSLLGSGCNAPCGAYCRREGENLVMTVMFAGDGKHPVYRKGVLPLTGNDCKTAISLAGRMALQVRKKAVSLVGAGPGDSGLITEKGLECVRQADVIVYDNLISGSVLNEAKLDAELIYCGKRSGNHHMSQQEIHTVLVKQAKKGKYVVRLKGGDPFIFGRGGEEALKLQQEGISFELVPGVSSSSAVPAYAGIPVTHRDLASSFHVITGHGGNHSETANLDFSVLAKEEGTLVFLMGLNNLGEIAEQLIRHGKEKQTPVAVISRGMTARQKLAVAPLEEIEREAARCQMETPAVIVVGDVVTLSETLNWLEHGPLYGKRILLTGTRHMVHELEQELQPLGAETVAVSLIESRPLMTDEVKQAVRELSDYHWLVFTSGNGVKIFFSMLLKLSVDYRRLAHLKFAVIGEKTGAVLAEHGFHCDYTPLAFSGRELAAGWIPELRKDEKVMLMRAKEGTEILPQELKKAGISYRDVPLYETWTDERRREELNRLLPDMDYITFASGSAVKAFVQLLDQDTVWSARMISIGPSTTETANGLEVSIDRTAAVYTAAGIAAEIMTDTKNQ